LLTPLMVFVVRGCCCRFFRGKDVSADQSSEPDDPDRTYPFKNSPRYEG